MFDKTQTFIAKLPRPIGRKHDRAPAGQAAPAEALPRLRKAHEGTSVSDKHLSRDFAPYIGLPYHPSDFNCWHLVQQVQREQFGRELPSFTVSGARLHEVAQTFHHAAERQNWHRTDKPGHGCCVLMRRTRYPIHIGVWLEIDGGGVLHNLENLGVVFQKPQDLIGITVEGYYDQG